MKRRGRAPKSSRAAKKPKKENAEKGIIYLLHHY